MNAKAETRSISMEYDLPHPPAKVWRALTEPELLAAWLMNNDMRPRVGQSFTFKDKPMPWWDGSCTARCWRSICTSACARCWRGYECPVRHGSLLWQAVKALSPRVAG